MTFIKIKFTGGLDCEAFQEVDANGEVSNIRTLDGEIIEVPSPSESHVIDASPDRPDWADSLDESAKLLKAAQKVYAGLTSLDDVEPADDVKAAFNELKNQPGFMDKLSALLNA